MVQITEENRAICTKEGCEAKALTYMNGMWLCGNCLIKLQEKIDKFKQSLILEE